MKRILFPLLAVFCILCLTACDSNDSPNGSITDPDNLFSRTYTMNSDGCYVLEGLQPARQTVIDDEVKGYGWKVFGIYELKDDGTLSTTDWRTTVIGGGYTDYWMEADGHLIGFQHGDTPGRFYDKTEWTYDASTGFIMRGGENQSIQSRYMQVLSVATDRGKTFFLYTMQKLGDISDEHGSLRPFYGMVVYQRMTDAELAQMKQIYAYDADRDYSGAVPNSCKFRVTARYRDNDSFAHDTNGSTIVTFADVEFALTDNLGTSLLPNPALEYFDSIVWSAGDISLPMRYVIHRHSQGQGQTQLKWTTCFFYKKADLKTRFEGYKDGRVVYAYTMCHDIYTDRFLCYDWEKYETLKPREHTAKCLLDPGRSFTVYEPRAYNGDPDRLYAELRYDSGIKGNGNDVALLHREASELTDLMTNHYGTGISVGSRAEYYRTLFRALPDKADITTYWETATTRIVLVCKTYDATSRNSYYYVHAEPRHE